MKIKNLSASDTTRIKLFEKKNPPEKNIFIYPDKKEVNFLLNEPHCKAFGIFDKAVLVGWGGYMTGFKDYSLQEGYFEVSAIYIDQNYQHKGLGKLLLEKVIKELKKNEKWEKIFLTVSPLNKKALSFYLNNNFVIFDFKRDYYGEGEDRLFLSQI